MRNYRKHTGSKAKTTRSRSSRPTRFGYGMTGISLITILAMQAVKSDLVVSEDTVSEDTVSEDTTVSVSEDTTISVVEDTVADVVEDTVADVVDLGSMTKAELLSHAEKVGIKVFKSWNKTKIIETLSV